MTSKALTHQKDDVFKKRNDMVEYQVLLHDFQASRSLYEGLVQRLREAGVLSGIESGDVELVDLPTLPIKPAGFGPLPLMVITLALGAVLAFITAMFLESFDSSFHSVGALERYMRLPALAVIPEFPSADDGAPSLGFSRDCGPPEQRPPRRGAWIRWKFLPRALTSPFACCIPVSCWTKNCIL